MVVLANINPYSPFSTLHFLNLPTARYPHLMTRAIDLIDVWLRLHDIAHGGLDDKSAGLAAHVHVVDSLILHHYLRSKSSNDTPGHISS